MFERIRSFRQKKRDSHFPWAKLDPELQVKILASLPPPDLTSFAATSKESDQFVRENAKYLQRYEFDILEICYDPRCDAICLRGYGPEDVYRQSVVLEGACLAKHTDRLSVMKSVVVRLGAFNTTIRRGQTVAIFKKFHIDDFLNLRLPAGRLEKAIDFFFRLDNLLLTLLYHRSWTECEKFKVDNIVLILHEKLYASKAAKDDKSRFKRLFKGHPNTKISHFCRKTRVEKALNHLCRTCTEESLVSVTFPVFEDDLPKIAIF